MAGCTYFVYRTGLGRLTLESDGVALTRLAFGSVRMDGDERASALANRASSEILEYLSGRRRAFDVPLAPAGTAFQQAVWRAASRIPYGQTRTYAEVAREMGKPGSLRAVGAACKANPLPLLVPTHRIVGSHGKLGGFVAGYPADQAARIKRFLLEVERRGVEGAAPQR